MFEKNVIKAKPTPRPALVRLNEFQKAAEELRNSAFLRFVESRHVSLTTRYLAPRTPAPKGGIAAVRPKENDMAAYAGSLRAFLLSDDDWTIDKLPQVYRELNARRYWLYELSRLRGELRDWCKLPFRINLGGLPQTNISAFELFTYGQVVHRTKSTELAKLKANQVWYETYLAYLTAVFRELTHFVFRCYHLNHWVTSSNRLGRPLP